MTHVSPPPRSGSISAFSTLLSPIQVGSLTVRNRTVMGSMHSGLEDRASDIPKLAAYLGRRAEGGAGLIVTGGFAPNIEGWLTPFGSTMASRRRADRHRAVTDAVHSHDSHIVLQILHAGRYGYSPLARSASTSKSPISPFKARRMSGFDIERTIRAYVRAAKLAKRAGYDGIEIMGSEGYLLNQFLAERTNHRTDAWGGSAENRMRLPVEIVRRIRAEVGPEFLLQYRISLLDLVDGGQSWSETTTLAQRLEDAGVDVFNTGIGWHEARVPTIVTSVPRAAFADLSGRLRKEVSVPVVASNRINRPEVAEEILTSGIADLVSMARPFLADPDFVNKAADGRALEINTCIGCNQACLDHTFAGRRATCLVNPRAAYETELVLTPVGSGAATEAESDRRRFAIIGGGVAGLACAEACAERGLDVEVFEAADRIGGQFRLAAQIPGKEDYADTLTYFEHRLAALDVPVHTGRWVSAGDLLNGGETEARFDHVIVATGVNPRIPAIDGIDHGSVIRYDELLSRAKSAGRRVAVIGAGGIGIDVCEFLTREPHMSIEKWRDDWGVGDPAVYRAGLVDEGASPSESQREVHLLQRKTTPIGKSLGKTTGWVHRAELKKAGVKKHTGVVYERIDDAGLHITVDGKTQVIEVDSIIVCTGQISDTSSVSDVQVTEGGGHQAADARVTIIGGADVAAELDAKRAIRQAYEVVAAL